MHAKLLSTALYSHREQLMLTSAPLMVAKTRSSHFALSYYVLSNSMQNGTFCLWTNVHNKQGTFIVMLHHPAYIAIGSLGGYCILRDTETWLLILLLALGWQRERRKGLGKKQQKLERKGCE